MKQAIPAQRKGGLEVRNARIVRARYLTEPKIKRSKIGYKARGMIG